MSYSLPTQHIASAAQLHGLLESFVAFCQRYILAVSLQDRVFVLVAR